MIRRLVSALLGVGFGLAVSTLAGPPAAHADICPYPGVGVGVNILVGHGGYCEYPTEINGSHMHCETGGFGLGGGGTFAGDNGSLSLGGSGIGGASCTFRCPDGTMAPAPNPPGAWRQYLVPMTTTNFCAVNNHMTPNGWSSAPVLPTEGIPPVNEQAPAPGETLPPQPVPPPAPTPAPDVPLIPPLAPGQPDTSVIP